MTQLFSDFDFSQLSSPDFKEDSVREVLILPLLYELGYKQSQIQRSKSLKHPFVTIGCREQPVKLIPDYLLKNEDGNYAWVLDAKAPKEKINIGKNVGQVFSYSIHPEIRTNFFALCNGRQFSLFKIDENEPVLYFELSDIANNWEKLKEYLSPSSFGFGLIDKKISLSLNFSPKFHVVQNDTEIEEILDKLDFRIKNKIQYSINIELCIEKYNENEVSFLEKEKIEYFLLKIREEISFKLNLFAKANIGNSRKNIAPLKESLTDSYYLYKLYEDTIFYENEDWLCTLCSNTGKGFDIIKNFNKNEISFRIYLDNEEFDYLLSLVNRYFSREIINKNSTGYDIAMTFLSLRLEVSDIQNENIIDKIMSSYLRKMFSLKEDNEYHDEFEDISSFIIGLA